jgi:hypothetical protein
LDIDVACAMDGTGGFVQPFGPPSPIARLMQPKQRPKALA